jgi:hypothetical protein
MYSLYVFFIARPGKVFSLTVDVRLPGLGREFQVTSAR